MTLHCSENTLVKGSACQGRAFSQQGSRKLLNPMLQPAHQ